jgi:hypothetical protein
MALEEIKTAAIVGLQDANMMLCNVYFLLDEHTSPAFNKEMDEVQTRIRDMIGAVEKLQEPRGFKDWTKPHR